MGHLSTVALVWMWSRNDVTGGMFTLVLFLLLATAYKPLLVDLVAKTFSLLPWQALLVKALTVFSVSLVTFQMYLGITSKSS